MLVWWAVFFVSGFFSSSKSLIPPLFALALMLRGRGIESHGKRFTLFVLCATTSLVLWTAAQPHGNSDATGPLTGGVPAFVAAVRDRLIDSLDDSRLSGRSADLLAALLYGSRKGLDSDLRETYAYLGIAHFLALSGLHLGILMVPLTWVTGFLPMGRGARSVTILAVIASYCLVAGMPPSLVRSVALAAVFVLQRSEGRKTTLARSLLLAALLLALIDERILYNGGFQLSCSAVLAIAVLGIPVMRLVRARIKGRSKKTIVTAFVSPIVITVSVSILTLPLQLSFFGRAPILAPLFNLMAVLPVTLLLYLGLAHAALPIAVARRLLAVPINLLSDLLFDAPLMLAGHRQPAIFAGNVCWHLYAAGVLLIGIALRPNCGRRNACGIAATALLISSFAVGGIDRLPRAGDGVVSVPEPRRLSTHTTLFTDRILVIEEEIGRREAEWAVRGIWKSGTGRIERLLICPSRLRGWGGIDHIVSRIEFDEAICSPYLPRCDGGLIATLRVCGVGTRFVEGPDSIEAGGWMFHLLAPPYPPPVDGPIPAERARLRIAPYRERRTEGI